MRPEMVGWKVAVFKYFKGCHAEKEVHWSRVDSEVENEMSGRDRDCIKISLGKDFPT